MSEGGVTATMDEAGSGILLVTIDNPPVNAMSIPAYQALTSLFEGLEARSEVRCAILTGAGERAFIAGADVRALSTRTTESSLQRLAASRRAYMSIRQAAVPVIAAVNGPALGAGMVIASVCDMIVASERAVFALPEIDVGALGGGRHLQRILPEKITREMALTGRRMDAHTMERHGAVNAVVPHAALMAKAREVAATLAAKSPRLLRLRKDALNLAEELPVADGYRVEQLFTTVAASIPDAQEAARAVAERRPPRWSA